MDPAVRLPLDDRVLQQMLVKACDWAAVHGLVLRTSKPDPAYLLELAPFALLPSPFPRHEYAKVTRVQKSLNSLIHRVAYNERFLEETLRSTVNVDEFTARLFRINETVLAEGRRQPLSLGIFRCDYMLDTSKGGVHAKQVEMNTISSSFSSLATQMTDMHKYVLSELGRHELLPSILDNRPVEGFARAFVAAWKAYDCMQAAIVFLVEPFVRMIGDHKLIDCEIKKHNSKIPVLRRTMADFVQKGRLLQDGTLMIDEFEVAVVYYRDGYTPDSHIDENYWDWRLKVERSKAIKCPSIQYQLAGLKKVQQRLADPNVLSSFLSDHDPAEVARVSAVFTGLFSLDQGVEGDAVEMSAHEHPERFVLKPQREGGGNNVYGDEISRVLRSLAATTPSERYAYILMDRIVPPTTLNYLVRPSSSATALTEVVSELGIYGIILGSDKEILLNEDIGHLLRTKPSTADEGGVVAGYACLDAMLLT